MKRFWNSLLLSTILLPGLPTLVRAESTVSPTSTQSETAPVTQPDYVVPTVDLGGSDSIDTPTTEAAEVSTPSAADPEVPASSETVPTTSQERVESFPPAPVSPEASPAPNDTEQPETESSDSETSASEEETEDPEEVEPSPEELARQQKLMQADQLYLGGQFAAAEKLYREAKEPFPTEVATEVSDRLEPMLDPSQLPPAGQVYWRESEAGLEQKLETRTLVPLNFLVEKYPQFVPGHLRLAQALQSYDREEAALTVLERATTLYPSQPDLLAAKVKLLEESEQWLEASVAARQFALLNPSHPASAEFASSADENMKRFQGDLKEKLTGNAIANAITGTLGLVFTGNIFAPLSAVQTTALLLRGESAVGESVAEDARRELDLIEDEAVVAYINEIGQRIATVTGRKDFEYEFYVIMDDRLNAFALPGGKVFINAGAILNTQSEAELAGLISHELAHAVLSHGFQLVAEGNLVANAAQYFPLGGAIANLFVLDYSRDMERQADILGTQILTATGYAADGMRNLMVTLKKQDKDEIPFTWLSTHPANDERIRYLEELIQRNGYNRYAYEGVARHAEVKARVKELVKEYKQRKKEEEEQKKRDREREE